MPNYVCDGKSACLKYAVEKKYKVFALQYGGECWVDHKQVNNYEIYGKIDDTKCNSGNGGDWANAVYQILCK